jgi:hypothetical protein
MTQRKTKKTHDAILDVFGPPSSPPNTARRVKSTTKKTMLVIKKSMTEKARLPGGVMYF